MNSQLVAAAEERHKELSNKEIIPLIAAQHYPDAHHIGTFEAPVVPSPELPLCEGSGGPVLSASGMADAADQGLRQLASDSGFLALTAHAHTTLLVPLECGSDGHCRKAWQRSGVCPCCCQTCLDLLKPTMLPHNEFLAPLNSHHLGSSMCSGEHQ